MQNFYQKRFCSFTKSASLRTRFPKLSKRA